MSAPDLEIRACQIVSGTENHDLIVEYAGDLAAYLKQGGVKDAGHSEHEVVIQFRLDGNDTDLVLVDDSRTILDSLLDARRTIDLALSGLGVER